VIVFKDGAVHRAMELGPGGLTIGRGLQNDLVLEDPDRTVSRFHAEVRQEAGGWVLLDLNSQNGTWVESRRVDRVELRAGVPVVIGRYSLVFDDTPFGV
jgi:pSer/pThr/pTyr-binding forkhead associated (FHA) protein